ncbi:MAG: hypothetical protein ACC645_22295 [Pirellulales bacterium]
MQNTRRRLLHVCIDLEAPFAEGNSVDRADLDRVGDWLIQRVGQYGIPATWAVADPVHSAVTSRLLSGRVVHELAVLGDRTWVGPAAGRRRFAAELTRRVLRARAAGLSISTLATRHELASDHLDLLVKHGITALRAHAVPCSPGSRVEAIGFGLWKFSVHDSLPRPKTWLNPLAGRSIARRLRRAVQQGPSPVVLIDASGMSLQGARERRRVDYILNRIACWSRDDHVRVETLAQAASRLSAPRPSTPAHSILRKAV